MLFRFCGGRRAVDALGRALVAWVSVEALGAESNGDAGEPSSSDVPPPSDVGREPDARRSGVDTDAMGLAGVLNAGLGFWAASGGAAVGAGWDGEIAGCPLGAAACCGCGCGCASAGSVTQDQ